jgi:DNA phosphorothioation-dependent restriction protein DptH
MTRLAELADYGLFEATVRCAKPSRQFDSRPGTDPQFAEMKCCNERFRPLFCTTFISRCSGAARRDRITHAVIFDEAHRAARLKLIPTMAKECRKYGLSFVVASQEAKDFDSSLFTAVANYLALRVSEPDAKLMAKIFAPSDKLTLYTDRIKQMAKFKAWFYSEGMRAPTPVVLGNAQHG